jgi:hypothetical protein
MSQAAQPVRAAAPAVAFPPERGTLRDYAAAYLAAGWSVFPLKPLSKLPHGDLLPRDAAGEPTWKPYQTARPRLDEVDRWLRVAPRSNLAVVTGAISGIAVLDVDGEAGAAALKATGLRVPDTLVQKTPHGAHAVYRLAGQRIRNTAGAIAPHVDTRGEGGYIVAPPSRLADGAYEWRLRAPLADAPPWMVAPERDGGARTAPGAAPATTARAAPADEREGWVRAALEHGAPEGQRNALAARLAGYFHSRRIAEDIIVALLRDTFGRRCSPPLDDRELAEVVRKVCRYPVAPTGLAVGPADGGVLVLDRACEQEPAVP